jgi:hypothetical protein
MNMSSAQLNITNEEGEQEKLSELHTITEKYGTSNTSLPERQKLLFDQLKSDDHITEPFHFLCIRTFFKKIKNQYIRRKKKKLQNYQEFEIKLRKSIRLLVDEKNRKICQ